MKDAAGSEARNVTSYITSLILKDLKEKELIYTDKTGYLFFTEQGQKQASQVYERHIYFKNQLLHAGVESVLAEEEACRMEHTISEESFKKLKGSKCVRSCIDCKGDDCK